MSVPALAIMVRIPSPEGKSRLRPLLSPEQRESLQWAFLLDTLDKARLVPGIKCFVAATPGERIYKLKKYLQTEGVISQGKGELGRRMHRVISRLYKSGHSPVILIGTDAPALPANYIKGALDVLIAKKIVLGPALDGGYYLIGMHRPQEKILTGIAWGGDKVLQQTIALCRRYKLTYGLLGSLGDIDRPGDIMALAGHVYKGDLFCNPPPARTIAFVKQNLREDDNSGKLL